MTMTNTTAPPRGANKIFRQAALDRLSSPEQLDRLITLPAPRDWWAAAALCGILAIASVWGVFGSIPTTVEGPGILVASGGQVYDAFALADGVVREIIPKIGDRVSAGDLIARVSQPEMVQSLESARDVVEERTKELENLKAQTAEHARSRALNNQARRRAIEDRIADAQRRQTDLQKEADNEAQMFAQHLITWDKFYETRAALGAAQQVILDGRSQLDQIDAEEIAARNASERDLETSSDRLTETQRHVVELEQKLQLSERVVSPANGTVTEYKAAAGSRVAAGTPVISIESGATGVELILYLPPDQGKEVRPGMGVRIAPSTVQREEFGTIIGTVRDVSEFPSTDQAMAAVLQNDALVKQFSPKGSPFAAHVDLVRDDKTPTGYRWSGGSGPKTTIASGTIAMAEVTVRELPPVAYIIPLLRKYTGLDN